MKGGAWVVVLYALGCASSSPSPVGPPPRLQLPESGGQAVLTVGQELALQLDANASTGFRWDINQPVPDVVAVVDSGTYREPPDPEAKVGAGGSTSFLFKAIRPGKGVLELVYRRPWETGVAPAKATRVELEVR